MDPVLVVVIGAVVLIVVALGVWLLRGQATPTLAAMQEIERTVVQLQSQAADKIRYVSDPSQITAFDPDEIWPVAHAAGTLRFVYTIERNDDGVLHVLSSQLIARRPRKYQIQSMLLAMMVWGRQLKEAGVDPATVPLDVSESELGTHYLQMLLTEEQHAALMSAAK